MINFLRPVRIGGASGGGGPMTMPAAGGGIDWGAVFGSVTGAARDVFVAREKRRAVGRGADANTIAAMEPGRGFGGAMFGSSGGLGLAALGLGVVALVLLVK